MRLMFITLPNSDGKILPGSYVEISINVVSSKASPLVVPANVLVVDQAGTHVVTVDAEKHIAFRPVKLGRDFGREVEIVEGIDLNHLLVASPSDLLVEGETVKIVESSSRNRIINRKKKINQRKKRQVNRDALTTLDVHSLYGLVDKI